MNCRMADSELVADVTDRGLRVVGVDDHRPLRWREFVFAAALSPPSSGCLNASSGPLPNPLPLILGEGGDDVEVELSARSCGIDGLGQRGEANSLLLEPRHQIIELPHVPSKPV